MRVLVTDGRERAALAVVRSLGRAGHDPFVLATGSKGSLAGASRFAREQRQVPDPMTEPSAYVEAVARAAAEWDVDVLLPVSEASLHRLLPARDRFPGVTVPFPEHAVFERICDKARVLATARELGIPVPEQVEIDSRAGTESVTESLRFPVVLKPARSVVTAGDEASRASVVHVRERSGMAAALEGIPEGAYPVLVQERITGPGTGVFLLLWDGELRAAFAHERILEKPPSGGVSVLRRSVRLEPELLEMSRSLLEELAWQGVAMVEYKRDAETGTPYLMEINGRFWGSLQLAVDAGVDFPRLLLEAATGHGATEAPVLDYREDVRLQWFWGRVDHEILACRRLDAERGTSIGTMLRVGLGFARDLFNPQEVFRWRDPRPFFHETSQWVKGVLK